MPANKDGKFGQEILDQIESTERAKEAFERGDTDSRAYMNAEKKAVREISGKGPKSK